MSDKMRRTKDIADSMRALAKEEVDSLGLIRVTAEQLNDWADAIHPEGYLLRGHDLRGFVQYMSRIGKVEELMRECCALYGMQLTMDRKFSLTLERTSQHAFGFHVGELLSQVQMAHGKWYDYNATFKLTDTGVEVALEGLRETHNADR